MKLSYNYLVKIIERIFRVDARYFLKGGSWLTIGQVTSSVSGIATTYILAHILSETDYGIYRYLLSVATILSFLSLTGLGKSILQAAANKYFAFYQETFRINLLSNIAVLLSAIGVSIYYYLQGNITLSVGCLLITFLQPLINIFRFVPSYLIGSKRFKESTILKTLKVLFVSVSTVISLFLTQEIIIVFAVYLSSNLLINILSHLYFRPRAIPCTPLRERLEYLSYAKHTSIRNMISGTASKLDSIVLFTQLGAAELAVYAIAMVVPEHIKESFKNLYSLILPKYAESKDLTLIKKNIPKRSLQLFFVFLLASIAYIITAPIIYDILFPKYENSVFLSQIIALSFPATIAILPMSLLQSEKKEKKLHLFNIQSTVFSVISLVILIPLLGIMGAIVAKVSSRYFNVILSFYHLYKK